MRRTSLFLGLIAPVAIATPAFAQSLHAPVLEVAPGAIIDDLVVVTASRPAASVEIGTPVYEPPVSLREVTGGLVAGKLSNSDGAQDLRAVARQQQREAEFIHSLPHDVAAGGTSG